MAMVIIPLVLFLSQPATIAFLSTVLLAIFFLLVWEAYARRAAMPRNLFVLGAIGLGVSLGIGVELITIKGDINRMNTVFKFYLQAWVLFGLTSAYCLWLLVGDWILRKTAGFGKPA